MENIVKRNTGIDFLRIICMYMVVMVHVFSVSNVLNGLAPTTLEYAVISFFKIIVVCAVNCYALIIGYVSVDVKFRYSRIIYMWMQVFFYSVSCMLLYMIINPEPLGIKEIIRAFFPVLGSEYWYFTSYFGMFFFIPLMNQLIHSLSRKQYKNLIITSIILFSVMRMFAVKDLFTISSGYSTIWLMALYFVGGYIKLYGKDMNVKKKNAFLLYFIAVAGAWICKLGMNIVVYKLSGQLTERSEMFTIYSSPFTFFMAVGLFLFFLQIEIKKKAVISIINFFAPISFGVYLIHNNTHIRSLFIKEKFEFLAVMPIWKLIITAFLLGGAMYLICTLVDFVRLKIFSFLKIDLLSKSIIQKCSRKI